jgi:hypothetical protein
MRDKRRLWGVATRGAGVLALLVWALALGGCPEAEEGDSNSTLPGRETGGACLDSRDNDGDGDVDCADDDCAGERVCARTPENCNNGVDDDGDGRVDCNDDDCRAATNCMTPPEDCENDVDDDGDGDTDCDDDDCAGDDVCSELEPEDCGDELDNDGDGATDCDDNDCASDPACVEQQCPLACATISLNCAQDFLEFGCPQPVVDGLEEQCVMGCADETARAQIIQAAGLPCAAVVPLAVEGFGLGDVCAPAPMDEVCDDEQDNDNDGDTDCADSDCADDPACEVVDPCADVVCDAPPANDCEDAVAVTYPSVGACMDGVCGYEATRTDCAATEQLCEAGACVDPPDPCAGVVCDAPPAAMCDGQVAVTYPAQGACAEGECSYEATRANCAANGQICEAGACVAPPDPCQGVVCNMPPAAMCDGQVAVTYGVSGTCDDGECSYEATRADCAANGQLCEAGACVAPPDPCQGVICNMPPSAMCDGQVAVTYGVSGTCDDGECSYAAMRADCAANEQICEAGACVNPPVELCDDEQDNDGDGDIDCDDTDCAQEPVCNPTPGTCALPFLIDQEGFFPGNTAETENNTAGLCGGGGNEQVWAFQLEGGATTVCLNTFESAFDTVLYVRAGDCFEGAEAACNDDAGRFESAQSEVEFTAQPGVTYFVFVDGFDANERGDYGLAVALGPCSPPQEICDNELDDDGDLSADCADSDCIEDPACVIPFEDCGNERDDDGDEAVDCADPDCAEDPFCFIPVEICGNEGDDDGDELADCNDPDCFEDPFCFVPTEICNNEVDDDNNGLTDCDDLACGQDPSCAVIGPNGTCAAPFGFDRTGAFTGDSADAANEHEGSCQANDGVDEVWSFGVLRPTTVCIDTIGSSYDTILYVRSNDCAAGEQVVCNDDGAGLNLRSQVELQAEPDINYFVFVDAYTTNRGAYTVNIRLGPCGVQPVPEVCGDQIDNDQDGFTDCEQPVCALLPECRVGGGLCEDPYLITATGTFTGNSAASVSQHSSSCGGSGREDVWAVSVSAATPICLDTFGSAFDTILYARQGDCAQGQQVACNDDSQGTTSQMEFQAEANTTYFIFVDAFGSNLGGAYNLNVSLGPCAARVEVCDDGFDNDNNGTTDCDDLACAEFLACLSEAGACNDGEDNDLDGDTDCADEECFEDPLCQIDATPIAPQNGTILLEGSLDNTDPTWARPSANCTPGTAPKFYDAIPIVNETGATQRVDITAQWLGDGYLHIFRAPFDPNNLAGCLVGSDDFGNNGSQIINLTIQPGEILYVVASTFSNNVALGAYSISVYTEPASIAAPGQLVTLAGSLDNTDPTWARPNANCTAGTAPKFYDTFAVFNETGAQQVLTINAFWPGDGYVHVFRPEFDAVTPTTNCVLGDDDFAFNGQPGSRGSQILNQVIEPGEILIIVASTFNNNVAFGSYTIDVVTNAPQ